MNAWFEAGFTSGRIVDLVLLLLAAEALALVLYQRLTGRGIKARAVASNLGSGACLLLALRAALTGGHWGWIALPLSISLVCHLLDLRQRWQERSGQRNSAAVCTPDFRSEA